MNGIRNAFGDVARRFVNICVKQEISKRDHLPSNSALFTLNRKLLSYRGVYLSRVAYLTEEFTYRANAIVFA